jgi:uncharacterized protein
MPIPRKVTASSAVVQRKAYSGELPVSGLERLRLAVTDDASVLKVELHAERVRGREMLEGTIDGRLSLRCQRCEKPTDWPLHVDVELRLVYSEEEEESVLHEADPYLVQNDSLPLQDIVEDEVLLALPMLPRCESCEDIVQRGAVQVSAKPHGDDDAIRREPNPFAALKERLGKQQ